MITNCNCAQRITCGCTVSFDAYSDNLYSALSVGNLTGGSCILEGYVIDWYRNGVHTMTSGRNIPGLDAYHPFTGASAIPVQAGTWKPVLRYVVIAGEKVFPHPRNCQKWCSDLQTELPVITVMSVTCDIVAGNPASGYSFRIGYKTTQDYSFATRSIRWDLPPDGSMKYLALQFTTYYVPDRVQVFYNDETQPLRDIVVGFDRSGTRVDSDPIFLDQQWVKLVANLTEREYQPGDYLTIRVTPSSNPNTEWVLDLKCLQADAFECNLFPVSLREIDLDSVTISLDKALCNYQINFNVNPLSPGYTNSNIWRYLGISSTTNGPWFDQSTGKATLRMSDRVFCNAQALHTHYDYNSNGLITYAKTGSTFTFTFESRTDFDMYKTWYNYNRSLWKFSSFNPDPTHIDHYKIFQIAWKESPTRCGDVFTHRQVHFHWLSPVVFNDTAMTMAIGFYDIVNQYPNEQPRVKCSDTWDVINQWVNACRQAISQPDWSGSTRCREQRPVNGIWIFESVVDDMYRSFTYSEFIYLKYIQNVCTMPGWKEVPSWSWYYMFKRFVVAVEFTDPVDRMNNFILWDGLNHQTGEELATYVKIYEVKNGIKIYP